MERDHISGWRRLRHVSERICSIMKKHTGGEGDQGLLTSRKLLYALSFVFFRIEGHLDEQIKVSS